LLDAFLGHVEVDAAEAGNIARVEASSPSGAG
jgi:hypothetical protein